MADRTIWTDVGAHEETEDRTVWIDVGAVGETSPDAAATVNPWNYYADSIHQFRRPSMVAA